MTDRPITAKGDWRDDKSRHGETEYTRESTQGKGAEGRDVMVALALLRGRGGG